MIIIGVTGGIAAYKAASVVSVLVKRNYPVKVIMTESAKQFITPLTFSALSHNPVYGDHNRFANDGHIHHIELAEEAKVMAIVPATYNTIRKLINGTLDNLLLNTLIAFRGMGKPIIICPAMNTNMWNDLGFFQDGIPIMRKGHVIIVKPREGTLACGSKGMGIIAHTTNIVDAIIDAYEKN